MAPLVVSMFTLLLPLPQQKLLYIYLHSLNNFSILYPSVLQILQDHLRQTVYLFLFKEGTCFRFHLWCTDYRSRASSTQTAELGTLPWDLRLGCTNVRKLKCTCAKQFPSAHQDTVKGTKVTRYVLETMKIRD